MWMYSICKHKGLLLRELWWNFALPLNVLCMLLLKNLTFSVHHFLCIINSSCAVQWPLLCSLATEVLGGKLAYGDSGVYRREELIKINFLFDVGYLFLIPSCKTCVTAQGFGIKKLSNLKWLSLLLYPSLVLHKNPGHPSAFVFLSRK